MATSPEHLQALLDALQSYCDLTGMTISIDKTKVIYMVDAAPHVFTSNGMVIQQVATFRLHFSESGTIQHLITPLKPKMAVSWAAVQALSCPVVVC